MSPRRKPAPGPLPQLRILLDRCASAAAVQAGRLGKVVHVDPKASDLENIERGRQDDLVLVTTDMGTPRTVSLNRVNQVIVISVGQQSGATQSALLNVAVQHLTRDPGVLMQHRRLTVSTTQIRDEQLNSAGERIVSIIPIHVKVGNK